MTEATLEIEAQAPLHWERATINDTGRYVNGVAFKEADWHDQGLPIIRIQNLTDPNKPFNRTTREVREDSRIDNGDILVSWSATLDAFRWDRGPAVLNQHIFKVLPNYDKVDDRFLFYLLKEAIAEMSMSAHAHGSTMKHINRGPFLAHEVFLPPIGEQQEIVAEIETQFARLDDAVAALQRTCTRLKRYRASVLKAACEGLLVPTEATLARQEGRSYEPASVLLERIRAEREATPDKKGGKATKAVPVDTSQLPNLPEGWLWTSVDEISDVVRGASPRPAGDPKYFGGDIPWITVGALTANESPYLTEVTQFVTEAGKEKSRFIEPGTLLLTNSGVTLGVPKITLIGGCINDGSVALFGLCDETFKLYLHYYLRTQTNRLRAINQGAAQPNLNTSIVRSIAIPLPPLTEQERIVEEVERRLSVIDQMEATVEANLKRAESLRQSILRTAFSGQLV